MSKILAIETSCDETSVAILKDNQILSNVVSSQIDLHKKYGGVVPEIAARAHIETIIPILEESLTEVNMGWKDIDAIAVTEGPGLLGSLLIGVNTAKTLAYVNNKPLIPVHHIEGHIYSSFARKALNTEEPKFPILAFVVSGGHTSLILMKDHFKYEILGQTIDDAAGEVFDKVAKLLELGYPGGPIVSKLAENGNPNAYNFPRVDLTPLPARNDEGYLEYPKPSLDFSFSGLKTAVLNEVRNSRVIPTKEGSQSTREEKDSSVPRNNNRIADICASFQQTVIDILVRNSTNAINMYKPKSFVLCGGVSANKGLRLQLKDMVESKKVDFFVPDFSLSTDNAAMIGIAASYKFNKENEWPWEKVNANPNLKLT